MSKIDEVLSKINKLLSLSKGTTNVNEAAAAAAAAQKLMDEYNIEQASLEINNPQQQDIKEPLQESEPIINSGRVENWRYMLLNSVASVNNCRTVRYRRLRGQTSLNLVGRRSSIQTVRYLYQYLTNEIENLASLRRGCGREWIASYKFGLMEGVRQNLHKSHNDFIQQKYQSASGNSQALMVIDKAVANLKQQEKELDDYMSRYGTRKINTKVSNLDALQRGYQDGKNIKISSNGPQLSSGSRRIEG